ncbi:MAG: hypothetical protein ABIP75_06550 [Pyrinomonadaceae bacterium]
MTNPGAWHLITGEYPPAPGGVSDYTAVLADAMAKAGVQVHVWTGAAGTTEAGHAVTVHRIAENWTAGGLRALTQELDHYPEPRRLLIQYVPNAWGQRGMNLEFCRWVAARGLAGDQIRLMVHEPFLPYQFSLGPARWYMARVQRRMMRTLLAAADKVYLSIPGWEPMLKPYAPKRGKPMEWLPVFSNIPFAFNPDLVRDLRAELASPLQLVVGSFGTFGGEIGRMTAEIFGKLLPKRTETVGLLIGRGSKKLAAQVLAAGAVPATRLFAFEDVTAEEVSLRLQGCDVMVQPYPDGVSSRRSSTLAGLSHGLPIVTNDGFLTDPIWGEPGGVAAIRDFAADDLIALVTAFLRCEDTRIAFGDSARELYDTHFAVEHTVAELLGGPKVEA